MTGRIPQLIALVAILALVAGAAPGGAAPAPPAEYRLYVNATGRLSMPPGVEVSMVESSNTRAITAQAENRGNEAGLGLACVGVGQADIKGLISFSGTGGRVQFSLIPFNCQPQLNFQQARETPRRYSLGVGVTLTRITCTGPMTCQPDSRPGDAGFVAQCIGGGNGTAVLNELRRAPWQSWLRGDTAGWPVPPNTEWDYMQEKRIQIRCVFD